MILPPLFLNFNYFYALQNCVLQEHIVVAYVRPSSCASVRQSFHPDVRPSVPSHFTCIDYKYKSTDVISMKLKM